MSAAFAWFEDEPPPPHSDIETWVLAFVAFVLALIIWWEAIRVR